MGGPVQARAMADADILPSVKGILILDDEGSRLVAKYFGAPELDTEEQQSAFEKLLFQKTSRIQSARHDTDIIMLDNSIVVFHFVCDCLFYVIGKVDDNELLLEAVLNGLVEVLSNLMSNGLGSQLEKMTLMDQLEQVLVAVDEVVDGGLLLETDPTVITNRVAMRGATDDVPLAEQSLSQVMAAAREQMTRALLK